MNTSNTWYNTILKKMQLDVGSEPYQQNKPSAYLLATFSISNHL